MNWLVFVCLLGWIYILTVLYRAKLNFWYYICGSVGLFIFSLILIEPYVVVPLQKAVSAVAGVIGGLTHLYDSYFQQGILFIQNGGTSLSLYIDFECSGVIEMLAFLESGCKYDRSDGDLPRKCTSNLLYLPVSSYMGHRYVFLCTYDICQNPVLWMYSIPVFLCIHETTDCQTEGRCIPL